MTTIRAFFLQIRAHFSNFSKRAGETSPPPPLHPSSYAPEQLDKDKDTKFFDFQFPPTILQNMLFFLYLQLQQLLFLSATSKIVVFVYLQRFQELSAVLHILFLYMIDVTWFCFSKKIAGGHAFHYLLIKIFQYLRTNRQGLPENFVTLIFNVMLPFVSLYVFRMFRRSSF